jgi:hypothetical protein
MPFTVSHAIAAVPLRRLLGARAVASALVIGAMVPDARYFVPYAHGWPTHAPAALLWFALPLGLATYLLFHALLREPVLALLPIAVRQRLGALLRPASPAPLLLVAVSVLVGAASHLLWDLLTHHATIVTRPFPAFEIVVATVRGHHFRVYSVLQHVSSVVGLGLLVGWCRRWLLAQPVDASVGAGVSPTARRAGVALVVVVPLLAFVARWALVVRRGRGAALGFGLAIRAGGMAFALGLVIFALGWRVAVGSRGEEIR